MKYFTLYIVILLIPLSGNSGPSEKIIGTLFATVEEAPARALAKSTTSAVAAPKPMNVLCRVTSLSAEDKTVISQIGGTILRRSKNYLLVTIDINKIEKLAELSSIISIEKNHQPIPQTLPGSIISEGVYLTSADLYHSLGVTGKNTAIGIIDMEFGAWEKAQAAGELPKKMTTIDFSGAGFSGGGTHGTIIAEQITDIAPQVELHLLKINSLVDLENAIDYVCAQNIPIVSLSIAWAGLSYYDNTGPVNNLINDAHDNHGVFFAVAAGNYGESHWRGMWTDADDDSLLEFRSGDEKMALTQLSDVVHVVLNWNQYGYCSFNMANLELYVVDEYNTVVASSVGRGSGYALEYLAFYPNPEKTYAIVVERGTSLLSRTESFEITLIVDGARIEYAEQSRSIVDPGSAAGAFTVSAVYSGNWTDNNLVLEPFSSMGPTNDGRAKPDIFAPDGTASYTSGHEQVFGTSFSAPVVAGAASLILSIDKKMTTDQLEETLKEMAAGTETTIGKLQLDETLAHSFLYSETTPVVSATDLVPVQFKSENIIQVYRLDGKKIQSTHCQSVRWPSLAPIAPQCLIAVTGKKVLSLSK